MTGTDVALDHYVLQPSRRAAQAAFGGHTGDPPKKLRFVTRKNQKTAVRRRGLEPPWELPR